MKPHDLQRLLKIARQDLGWSGGEEASNQRNHVVMHCIDIGASDAIPLLVELWQIILDMEYYRDYDKPDLDNNAIFRRKEMKRILDELSMLSNEQ